MGRSAVCVECHGEFRNKPGLIVISERRPLVWNRFFLSLIIPPPCPQLTHFTIVLCASPSGIDRS